MRSWIPAATLSLLIACSSGNNRQVGDTGMADSAPGGLSSHDTMSHDSAIETGAVSGNTAVTPAGVLSELNLANTTEIQLASLASQRASSAQVKQIARKLAADHTRNRQQVQALAQKLDVKLTPLQGGSLSAADSAAMPEDLRGKAGTDFDKAFVQHEIEDHQANIDRIQNQVLPSIQNEEVKTYLQQTVTEMQEHLSSLKQVQQQLGS